MTLQRGKECFWASVKRTKITAGAAFRSDSANFSDVPVSLVCWNSCFDFELKSFFIQSNMT